MKTQEIKARVKATGKEIVVYKHREGGYVNSFDLDTKYEKSELELI